MAEPLAFFYDGNRMMGWSEQDGPYWHGTGSSVEDRLYEAIEGMAELHARLVDNEATLAARDAEIADMREVLADKRRLARELDVAMHGEEGAAAAPSLCDLIGPARAMRAEIARLKAEPMVPLSELAVAQMEKQGVDADLTAAREALRLAVPRLLLLIEMESEDDQEGVDAPTVAALRAIVAILPDALDGAPEWIVDVVRLTATDVDDRIGADAGGKGGDDAD